MGRLWLSVAVCALLGACGSRQPGTNQQGTRAPSLGSSARPPMAQSDSDELHHDDPCSLLDPKEVEAALGAPLGTAPYRGSNTDPHPDGSDCTYQTADFQSITLEVSFDGGQQAYHIGDVVGAMIKSARSGAVADTAKKAMVSDDGSEIAGEWDEAKLTPFSCCIFNALRADQMITIDFTGSTMTLKAAAALVDAAFRRIDKPLALDGGANVTAAKRFLKTRPQRMEPCSVLTRAEVEAIVGTLSSAPKSEGNACSYQLPQLPSSLPRIYQLEFYWHDGNYQFRQDLHTAGIAGAALGGMSFREKTQVRVPSSSATGSNAPASGTHTAEVSQDITVDEATRRLSGETFSQAGHLTGEQDAAAAGPWERSATVGRHFEAVKKDVLMKISLFGVDRARARALIAAAMKKL